MRGVPGDRPQAVGGAGTPGGHLFFPSDDRLEGILEWPEPGAGPAGEQMSVAGGVAIAHPHPLHGGTMAQPVVYRIAQACRQRRLGPLVLPSCPR